MSDQLSLQCKSGNKRPSKTEEMRRLAAKQIVADMVKYGVVELADAEASVNDIVKVTRLETDDGYKIARHLEQSCCWDCDMQIAEYCDQFRTILDEIYDTAEKKWDSENPATPDFAEGAQVMWRGEVATIHGTVNHRPQCYKVRQGEMGSDTSYYVVPFEDIRAPL